MSFLAGEYHLENVANINKATARKTKNSRGRSSPPAQGRKSKRGRRVSKKR